uniref:Cohesin subunit SA n=1 Tax=Kryptolebias marmoratus TaxID=37003 RepID=A0A3Q3A5G9_KRYMA
EVTPASPAASRFPKRRKRARGVPENDEGKRARAGCSGVGRGRGGRGKQKQHVEAVTLFEVITMGKSAIEAVVDDWIEAYSADRDSSLLDLISFFIQCCGCKGVVTAEMCQSQEDSDVRSKMVEELDEGAGLQYKRFLAFPWILTVTWPMDADSAEYPLVQSGPPARWFHSELCDFVAALVARCQHGVLFDGYLMGGLISLLTELSDSYVRAFRHTCTLAAVKVLSSLVAVALSLGVGVENAQKLHEVQRTKSSRQRSSQQLERIQKKLTEEKRAEIESMMDAIFKGVFLKRYRDMLPEIRSICMEELALWMKLYSSAFLNDSYLKYTGWMMHDKAPDVRLKCVLGLQGLYGDPVLLPKLDLFTSRFKDRLIAMTLDKDNEVAVQTMKLLMCDDVLTEDDYKQLLRFVYSSHRPLAATAGELLFWRYGRNKETRISHLLRHRLFLLTNNITLIQTLKPMRITSFPSAGFELCVAGFTAAEGAVMVEILAAAARQASEGPALPGRTGTKKVVSAREKKSQTDDCLKLTGHLLTWLPRLIQKFSCSGDIVASLMKIPQFFISDCPEAENTQQVSSLLAEMAAVVDLHSAPAVLEAAARSYLSLCGEGAAWGPAARSARDALVRRWVEHMGFGPHARVSSCCGSCHDLGRWGAFELLSPLLTEQSSQGGAPPEVLEEALRCLSFAVLWSLSASGEMLTCREEAVSQRLQLRLFCERSRHFLSHCELAVRLQAFLGVCDVLTAHSYQLQVWHPAGFGLLLYTPSPKLQRALLGFVCSHVFLTPKLQRRRPVTPSDGKRDGLIWADDLHRRRNALAAYCKLIVHGVLEMSAAAEVYVHYVKYNSDFGDIMKETMCRTRQINKVESARSLVLCLQQLFVRLKREQKSGGGGGRAHSGVQTFTSIKELARRFALTFGDSAKFRECVVTIHRNGVEFVFQDFTQAPGAATPPYLSYLTILSEFSGKLLKPDKKTVFSYLQKHTAEHVVNLREECWQPLVYYRASLLAAAETEDAASHMSSDRRPYPHVRSPLSKQKAEGKSPAALKHRSVRFVSPPIPELVSLVFFRKQVSMSVSPC